MRLTEDHAVLLGASLNGLPLDEALLFMQDDNGNLYARGDFLDQWNLKRSTAAVVGEDGTEYFPLSADQGLHYQWNRERGEVAIDATRDAFQSNQLDIGTGNVKDIAPYKTGAYVSYDVAFTQTPQDSNKAGFFEFAFFSGKSLITSSILSRDDAHARLMTTWQTDRVDKSTTLKLGDTYNAGSAWGMGTLYGGIQYGTNFELRPDYIPFATPSIVGTALLPSTVDVYVNNTLRSREQVEAGPFRIQNLPVITGSGDMQIIIKDLLGREQLMTQPFYVNPVLLREGLSTHSFEAGWQRRNYGLQSNDYHNPFAAATYRVGLSDALTTEGRIEFQEHIQTAGMAVATKLASLSSVLETSVAASTGEGLATGGMASARFGYQGQRWSFNARLQYNSDDFRQLGSNLASLPKQIISTQLSMPVDGGTLSLNYLRRLEQGESLNRILNLNYAKRISDGLLASIAVLYPLTGGGDKVAQLTFTYVFGNKNIGSVMLDSQQHSGGFYTQYQSATPREHGTGYRVALSNGDDPGRHEMQLSHNETFGSFQADYARVGGSTSTREMAQGSIALVDDHFYFAKTLDQGFAIVDTKGIAGVPVMLENQIVAHTDDSGRALISNVRAYQPNRISIDPLALPIEASVGAIEQSIVPRRCGCVLVDFDVRHIRSATLVVALPDGTLLPPWTPVSVAGMTDEYISGSRGEVFVDLPFPANNLVKAHLASGEECSLRIDQPAADVILPTIGPLRCSLPNR